ncbi:PT domain-containing protein [Nocardioides pacificus]
MTDAEKPKLEIDWLKTFAGALAAVSSAVLLSTLGAAGTLIGAALGSVVVTVTGALYSQGLARSRARLSHAQEVALARAGVSTSEVRRAQADLDPAVEERGSLEPESTVRDRLALLPWRRIALGAGALFLVAVVAITAFEVIVGRSVSSYTGGTSTHGGTSLTRLTGGSEPGGDPDGLDDEERAPSPGDDVSPGEEPSEDATGEPTAQPSTGPTSEPTTQSTGEPTTDPSLSPAPEVPAASPPTLPSTSPVG